MHWVAPNDLDTVARSFGLPPHCSLVAITTEADISWSAIITVVIVITVAAVWTILFSVSDKHPALIPSLAGCYLPLRADQSLAVHITASGSFQYGNKATVVVPYKDKQSWSLLPKGKVVVGTNGDIVFTTGNAILIRMNSDWRGFTVPNEHDEGLAFRKAGC